MKPIILRLFGAALVAAFLFGCGSSGKSPKGRVEVMFWHAMGGPLGDALDSMVQRFEATHPDIDIVPVSMGGYSTLSQKLMGAVQVNAPPVIAQMYESWTTQFLGLDKLVPLDSLVHGPDGLGPAELADFYPAFIDDNSWDGKLITLPFNKSVPVFFYNVEMLRQAGYDRFPETWEDFRQLCRKLTDRQRGVWGTAGGVNEWMFGCMLRQLGGDFLDEAAGRVLFNSAAGVRAAEFMHDLVARDSVATFSTGYDPQNDFLSGKLGCIWGTSVSWVFMKQSMTFPVGMARVPRWDKPNVLSFGTNIGIFRGAKPEQVAAGWKFIKWFTAPEQQAEWAVRTFYVPARRSSIGLPVYQEVLRTTPGLSEVLEQLEYVSFEPKGEAWFGGRRILGDALEKVMRGEATAKAALNEAAALVEKELKR